MRAQTELCDRKIKFNRLCIEFVSYESLVPQTLRSKTRELIISMHVGVSWNSRGKCDLDSERARNGNGQVIKVLSQLPFRLSLHIYFFLVSLSISSLQYSRLYARIQWPLDLKLCGGSSHIEILTLCLLVSIPNSCTIT